jgi:CO/xanthine dehydrogenase FAD-binding subunit
MSDAVSQMANRAAVPAPQYLRPANLKDALLALADQPLTILAGGTDFYPARVGKPIDADILDITRVAGLRGIRDQGNLYRIGARVTWSELIAATLPPQFDALKAAAREVGGEQIQNAGTVAGNLCNASPAADGIPPLMALGAQVELASNRATRRVALTDFVFGNRKTLRQPHELVTAVLVPKWRAGTSSVFLKLGHRKYLVISIVMVSVVVSLDESGRITMCGISVGACSAAAQRLTGLEAKLTGQLARGAAGLVTAGDLQSLSPIDDVRGSAEYRVDAALTLVRQAVAAAVAQEGVR